MNKTTRPVKKLNLPQLLQQQVANHADNGLLKKAKYLQISDALRAAIKDGLVKSNKQLPSARQLALELSSNRHTIMAAFDELIAEGWIESKQRRGYFVADVLPVISSRYTTKHPNEQVEHFSWQFRKQTVQRYQRSAADYRYNFAGGTPDISLFPFQEFKGFVNDALSRPDLASLNYGNNAGHPALIEQISCYLRRARALNNRKIVVVNGSQEALYVLSHLLLNEQDSVAIEAMGYAPAWNSFKSAGANLIPIAQDDKGMLPDSLSQAIEQQVTNKNPIKLIYLTPLHQYPTTVTLPIARRQAIYSIASDHNIAIIEDDYDHEFHYRCQPLAPMASDDPRGLVIYLSTFSKIMFPGARIGFMALDAILAEAVVNYKTIINHKVSVVMQDAIARWMQSGAFERYLRKVTKTYQQRRDFMVVKLQEYQRNGRVVSFTIPDGGMAIWIQIDHSAKQLKDWAEKQDIYLQAEHQFSVTAQLNDDRFIRLGFAGMDCNLIENGLERLFDHEF